MKRTYGFIGLGLASLLAGALALAGPAQPAQPSSAAPAAPHQQPKQAHAVSYRLTPDSFGKLLKADQKLKGLMPRDAILEQAVAMSGNHDAIDEWRRRLEMKADIAKALSEAGLTPGDYVATIVATIQASAVSNLKRKGKPIPASLAETVPADNVTFAQSHSAEIDSWQASLRKQRGSVKPNTLEDIYVSEDAPKKAAPAKDAPQQKP